jgi:putative membrane protein
MDLYPWVKALHVVAIIAWMAALLYLPRLLVYHAEAGVGAPIAATFKTMEWRLLKLIANPAMIAVWILGIALVVMGGWEKAGWLQVKLLFVILLSAYHGVLVRWIRAFAAGGPIRSPRFYRVANEVPTVVMIVIVILAVVKPF